MKTKNNFQKILVLIILTIVGTNASKAVGIDASATGKISGKICCAESNAPIEFATVTLFSATDSSLVAGTISNPDGSFYLSMLGCGEYFLEISESGFRKTKIETIIVQKEQPKTNLGQIQLQSLILAGNKHTSKSLKHK